MHIDEFRAFQREGAPSSLFPLVMACRRKFLNAACLLEVGSPALDTLTSFGVSSTVDPQPLFEPFAVLSERYVDRFFSPQGDLVVEPGQRQDEKWLRYLHHVLVPHLLSNNDVVRDILRAVRALPSRRFEQTSSQLGHYFAEMTLPETRPLWAPEESIDC